jgi:N-acetylglutamate synthase-like GNAT family acetyltransferase
VAEVTYRQAGLDDAAEIHELLLRIAPEIPLLVDTLEREEALYALTRTCARSGETWVACDADGRIAGFVLAELSGHGRHYAEHEVIELHYTGIAPQHRDEGVFAELIARLQARMLPIRAMVSPQNRSGAAAELAKHGFRQDETEHSLRWQPGNAS